MKKILIVDDDSQSRCALKAVFECEQFEVIEACNGRNAISLLQKATPDIAILDLMMPGLNGIDTLKEIKNINNLLPIIMLTGYGSISDAVTAVQCGAVDFLQKPANYDELIALVKKTIENNTIHPGNSLKGNGKNSSDSYQGNLFFGKSELAAQMHKDATLAAENSEPVLLSGETGTGKGILAKWIHNNSARADHEFVEINCSALKGDMLARELFGNIRGAFTSADRDNNGLLDIADGGTLLLDEIGDMDMSVQAQLLKVIEEKTYRRLGDTKIRSSNFRLIAATNKNLEDEMQRRLFRTDLFYRLNHIVIDIPPLREWSNYDFIELIQHLLLTNDLSIESLDKKTLHALAVYSWPGNIRELKSTLCRYILALRAEDSKPDLLAYLLRPAAPDSAFARDKEYYEKKHIRSALAICEGDVKNAAKKLGISKSTLYRKIKKDQNVAPVDGWLFN